MNSINKVHEVVLAGCVTTPLAAYLKALGILRLVAEQVDVAAKGFWRDEVFVLRSKLDQVALSDFFANGYRPTPILAPWNGGSGFYYQEEKLKEKDPKTGKRIKTGVRNQPTKATKTLDNMISSTSERLQNYRNVANDCKNVILSLGYIEAPKEHEKHKLLINLRAVLPDEALVALDAALVIGEDKPGYAPILGTGWNDGNLDFSNNFMQRLVELFDLSSGVAYEKTTALLVNSLFGIPTPGLTDASIGQFSPGAAGGPNATTGFDAASLINAWDFILMLEGAILFAAAATRRLESAEPGALSYPFTVRATGSGDGNTALDDEGNARAELWLPIWGTPTSFNELKNVLTEGRVTLGRTAVRDGLDFIRAVSKLGVDRGIDAFQRYAFVMRSGKAYLATPLSRVQVTRNPAASLIDELDSRENNNWLYRFRKLARANESPIRIKSLVRQLEDGLFDLARYQDPKYVQRVLILLGQAQRFLKDSTGSRANCPPVPVLSSAWVVQADDGSDEFMLARALASVYAKKMVGQQERKCLFMAEHFAPVAESIKFRNWDEEASHQVTWGRNEIEENLRVVLQRRLLTAEQIGFIDKPLFSYINAPLSSIDSWLNGAIDTRRTADLLTGLAHARVPFNVIEEKEQKIMPVAYALLKPFFCTNAQLRRAGILTNNVELTLARDLLASLWRGDDRVLKIAQRRLAIAGLRLNLHQASVCGLDGCRLLAALITPISDYALRTVIGGLLDKNMRSDFEHLTEQGETV